MAKALAVLSVDASTFHSLHMQGEYDKVRTDAQGSLNTLLVKYYNDLSDRQSSGWGRDEVMYFYVGDILCLRYLAICKPISGKNF